MSTPDASNQLHFQVSCNNLACMCKYVVVIINRLLANILPNLLASIHCKISMQVSYLYLVPFSCTFTCKMCKWPNYVQDSKISASYARLYIHKATFLARTRSVSSCKVTQVYSTWVGSRPCNTYALTHNETPNLLHNIVVI